ncbi:hypothetical protein [Streptomyces boluensis]|uniref:Uncharacterized protein n=1 Tax=Streptomyces boluensis TaxID=1775135 RepID=A0A964UXZ8_9ACTN|nr:hypothetical protein [Streptomyces boluensis]NBE56300.1 hypothetical protein [Streptomyces boluensis]
MSEIEQPEKDPAPAAVRAARGVAIGCGVIVAVPLLIVLGVIVTFGAQQATAEDYPTTAPEQAAEALTAESQELYRTTRFDLTLPPGVEDLGVSTENTLSADYCYPDGLESLADESVDGAYSLHHSWGVPDVPKDRALPALRRLRDRLKADGWNITDYGRNAPATEWELRATKDDRRTSFSWRPEYGYFDGGIGTACAYDPAWKEGDFGVPGEDLTPPELRPAH